MSASRENIEQKKAFMNDAEARRLATGLQRLNRDDTPRPESKSSLAALERRERVEAADDLAIALTVQGDLEDDDQAEVKKEDEVKKEKSIPPMLDGPAAISLQLSLFKKMPKAVLISTLYPYLKNDIRSLSAFARTCQGLNVFFKRDLIEIKTKLTELAQHVVYGERDEVELKLDSLKKANPKLLEKLLKARIQVTDYSKREIEGTLFQLAIGAEDVSREEFFCEGIADVIVIFLKNVLREKADLEIAKQFEQQFPAGYEEEAKIQHEKDIAAVHKMIAAIDEAKSFPDTKTIEAFDEFKNHLKPKGIITKGRHFNIDMLVEALKLHNNRSDFGSQKYMFIIFIVIGYLQRFLPACYAQVFCQGLSQIARRDRSFRERVQRSLKHEGNKQCFFPLDSDPSCHLGFNWGDTGMVSMNSRCVTLDCRYARPYFCDPGVLNIGYPFIDGQVHVDHFELTEKKPYLDLEEFIASKRKRYNAFCPTSPSETKRLQS